MSCTVLFSFLRIPHLYLHVPVGCLPWLNPSHPTMLLLPSLLSPYPPSTRIYGRSYRPQKNCPQELESLS